MLSKRASTQQLPVYPKRFREEAEITFVPSTRIDLVRTAHIFLREVNQPSYPYQITVTVNDSSLGRLGYYDLSYNDLDTAKKEYKRIIDSVENVREHIEYLQISSYQIEKLLRSELDAIIKDAVVFDSTYSGKKSAST